MSFDINKVLAAKQALSAQLARGGGGTGAKFWQPQNGKNKIRIMPGWETDSNSPYYGGFWREVSQHWRVNDEHKAPIVCPKNTKYIEKDSCPICDFVDMLKEQKDDPTAQEMANDLRAKKTYLLQIIDLAHPEYTAGDVAEYKKGAPDKDPPFEVGDPKLQVYACPISVFDAVLTMVSNTKKDITHLTKGYDLILERQYNKSNPKLTKYAVSPADFDATPAPISAAEFEQKKINLADVGRIYETERLHELLSTGVGADFSLPALPSKASAGKSKAAAVFATANTSFDGDDDDSDLSTSLPELDSNEMSDLQAQMAAALSKKKGK